MVVLFEEIAIFVILIHLYSCSMMHCNLKFLIPACLALFSCSKIESPDDKKSHEDYAILQFAGEPFLGETYVSDYDYVAGNQFLVDRYKKTESGACSSFRNGNFAARNLDWYVRNYGVLVVHTAANKEKGRYASVGIVSSNPFINREVIASGEVQDVVTVSGVTVKGWRNIFPIFTTDGVNEKGLCVNTNIVMHEDNVRDGYIPCTGGDDPTAVRTSFVSLPRFILDNCESCEDAIKKCGELHVSQAWTGALAAEDSHIFVSDMDQTVILEWYNDKMVVTRFPRWNGFRDEHNMPAIMTNFYNCIGKKYTDSKGAINVEKLLEEHPYAMGVERYETIRSGWEQATTAESAKELIKRVNYTNYFNLDSKWYTENGMYCMKYGDDWYYPARYPAIANNYVKANSLMEAIQKMYSEDGYMAGAKAVFGSLEQQMSNLNSGIDSENDWYTSHTSIFDIEHKELQIMLQEGWYNNKFYRFTVSGK